MHLPDEPELPTQINIVPMIDVIFAILTFFIMSSLFLSRSEGLPVNLPKASTAKVQQRSKVVVTVKPDGAISLNKKSIQLPQLETALRSLINPQEELVVIVNADEKVDHGKVIDVMDRVRKVNGAKLAIATRR
ncbi:MAG: biopolymer transporter ExbD [Acaryochloris sp. RU_4_1]|nr:biopolymer transporter ExbD [Acaryochloris sp. RU_4_1]